MMDDKQIQIAQNQQKLIKIFDLLLPWWKGIKGDILEYQTEEYPVNYLNSFYMYPFYEFTINSDTKDIPKFINQRFGTLYAAANKSNISVMLTIHSKNGRTKIYLGLISNEKHVNNKEVFSSLLNGILPGKKIEYDELAKISSMCREHRFGGIVTGVPIIKIDNERQQINLASVIRSLYGKDYTLSIISTPLTEEQKRFVFSELLAIRDQLHQMAKQTLGYEKGTGTSYSESEQRTEGISKTTGASIGLSTMAGAAILLGAGIGLPVGLPILMSFGFSKFLADTFSFSVQHSRTTSESYTTGHTTTQSQSETRSLTIEQQNGIALELEKIADKYIERYIKGFNVGLWETTITFSARDPGTCDILGGTLLGELSKPSNDILPPPFYFKGKLKENQCLFIPKKDLSNPIFPKALSSYITSEELASLASPPIESIPGFEIKEMPSLALTDTDKGEYILGNIADHGNPIPDAYFTISKEDLNKHVFVCGLTGSGKTTTIKHILKNLSKDNIPFLVLESAKRDYRQLLADEAFKDLKVFTIGDATVSPIRFNPFYVQKGIHPLVHIEYLKAIFNASFSLYGPMPHIIEKCLYRIYSKKGWDLTKGVHPYFIDSNGDFDESKYDEPEHYYFYPTLSDLKAEIENYINNEMDYKGELRDNIKTAILARIESLSIGSKGLMFNTYDFYPIDKLLKQPAVFEMENLADDEEKAFFLGLMLVLISEYRQKENPAINPGRGKLGLQHFLVIEEAHRLLKNVHTERISEMMGNPKGKAVEVFSNVIAEMRSLGQGVAVVEQIPSKISPDVIKNSNTKIVHRLVSKDDQILLAGSLGLKDDEALYLNRLKTGYALCHKEGMARPLECAIINDVKSHARSDYKIKALMENYSKPTLHPFKVYELSDILSKRGTMVCIRFLNSLCVSEDIMIQELLKETYDNIKQELKRVNAKYEVSKDILSSYCVKEIMRLITGNGIYAVNPKLPNNFVKTLDDVLKNENPSSYTKFKEQLRELWNVKQTEDFIIDAVKEFLKNYSLNTGRKITEKDIAQFFVCQSHKGIQNVILKIKQSLLGRL